MLITYNILPPCTISIEELYEHFLLVDDTYIVKLSNRVDIKNYTEKIYNNAYLIIAREKEKLVGLTAFYLNFSPDYTFCTDVSVLSEYQGKFKIGQNLVQKSIIFARENGSAGYHLYANKRLLPFYQKLGLSVIGEEKDNQEYHMLIRF